MASLIEALREQSFRTDLAHDIDQARTLFAAQGGHRMLVVGPDVTPRIAQQVFDSLRAVDPELAVLVFGEELLRHGDFPRATRIADYHPSSRAGVGAVVKALRSL